KLGLSVYSAHHHRKHLRSALGECLQLRVGSDANNSFGSADHCLRLTPLPLWYRLRVIAGNDTCMRSERQKSVTQLITDRMTMSAATPTHTPTTDAQVMKETKNLCVRART